MPGKLTREEFRSLFQQFLSLQTVPSNKNFAHLVQSCQTLNLCEQYNFMILPQGNLSWYQLVKIFGHIFLVIRIQKHQKWQLLQQYKELLYYSKNTETFGVRLT